MNQNQHESQSLPAPPARLHLVGIGGIGMSALARMLAHQGYRISGSDAAESPVVEGLRAEGFDVVIGHHAENLGDAELLIATAAVQPSNPELRAAVSRGVPVVKRAAVLGMLSNELDCIAVAGSHGKSTTSGMLAHALSRAGEAPSFAVGAVVNQLGTNAGTGAGRLFVAEADEYDYSFLWLRPRVAIVTNIEHDHPDLFPTLESIEDAFDQFVRGIKPGGALVLSADDPGCRDLRRRVAALPIEIVTFGFNPGADWRIERVAGKDHFFGPNGQTIRLRLAVPGRHNRLNAAAVLAASKLAGVDPNRLIRGLEEFNGVGRRFELKGEAAGVAVIDDYAHHPTEIRATIVAAQERYPGASVNVVFQPHTYSRTRQLLDEFASALDLADRVVLAPIYASRETDDLGVRSEDIAERMSKQHVEVVRDFEAAGRVVGASAQPGDVVLIVGAGDIWHASDVVLRRLQEKELEHSREQEQTG